jgi:hypothetical protein
MTASIQNDSQSFAEKILKTGSKRTINLESVKAARKEALTSAKLLLRVGRGRELLGTFSPLIIGELFKDHSSNWESLAQTHVKRVWQQAKRYVNLVLKHVTEEDVSDPCYTLLINAELDKLLVSASERLDDVMNELRQHPITYNHYSTDTVRKIRTERLKSQLMAKFNCEIKSGGYIANAEDMTSVAMSFVNSTKSSALLTWQVSLKHLIDNIPAQVIEPMVDKVPGSLPHKRPGSWILKLLQR